MQLEEALKILEVEGLTDKDTLKKAWKRQLKRYHPDLAGMDKELAAEYTAKTLLLKEAFNLCTAMATELESRRSVNKSSRISIIDIESLIKIYKGDKVISRVQFGDEVGTVEINKNNIRTRNVLICIPYIVRTNGVEKRSFELCTWNIKDQYSFRVQIKSYDITGPHDVSVSICDKTLRIKFNGSAATLSIRLSAGINVEVQLNVSTNTDT